MPALLNDDRRVYKIDPGIGILPENLCGARVIFLTRSLKSQFGLRKTHNEIGSGFVIDVMWLCPKSQDLDLEEVSTGTR